MTVFDLSVGDFVVDEDIIGKMRLGGELYHGFEADEGNDDESDPVSTLCVQQYDISGNSTRTLAEVAREITILKQFSRICGSVAQFYGAIHDADSDRVQIAMRCSDSNTLRTAILEFELPMDLRLHVCQDIVSAIESVHGAQMVHRNLCPEHIIMDDKWHAYVTGFGECVTHYEAQRGRQGSMTVTLRDAFWSPELCMNTPASYSTDIFSLGAVMYSLIATEVDDDADDDRANEAKVDLQDEGPFSYACRSRSNKFAIDGNSVRSTLAAVSAPKELKELITKCVLQDPDQRPAANECGTSLISMSIVGATGEEPHAVPEAGPKTPQEKIAAVVVPAMTEIQGGIAADAPSVSSAEAALLRSEMHKMQEDMKTLREDNERMRAQLSQRYKQGHGYSGDGMDHSGVPLTPSGAPVPMGQSGSAKEISTVLDSFLHVITKCADVPAREDIAKDVPVMPNGQEYDLPGSPDGTFRSKTSKTEKGGSLTASSSPTKSVRRLSGSDGEGLMKTRMAGMSLGSTSDIHRAHHNTPSSSYRRYKARPSPVPSPELFRTQVREKGKRVTRQEFSRVPVSHRRLHPTSDPRTPPKTGPGSRPSPGEHFRSIGSNGNPHVLNTDSKLMNNFFRADAREIKGARTKEYRQEKNHKYVSNAQAIFSWHDGPVPAMPQKGTLQGDMHATVNMIKK